MKTAMMDLSYNNTSMYLNIVEVYYFLCIGYNYCVNDGSWVCVPSWVHVPNLVHVLVRFLRRRELNDYCSYQYLL